MSPELTVFLVAMSPVVELRGAIPLAVNVYHLSYALGYFLSVSGNFIPLAGIVILARPISRFLSARSSFFERFFAGLFSQTERKTQKLNRLGRDLTVFTLTALPIPFIGGWTGALAAFVLEVPRKRALLLLAGGVALAGAIVTALTLVF
ncbi:MAG: small multi-drug export protein [Candidatus Nealsonbacteria bacterium]|nr:small multi-drug export protein [Candidatus Nealsonbacteria bacterium]